MRISADQYFFNDDLIVMVTYIWFSVYLCFVFSTMRKNNPETQKTFEAAAAFKLHDPHIHGSLTRQEFSKLHVEISRVKLITLDLDDCIGHLDSGMSGRIHFNDYINMILNPPTAGVSHVKSHSMEPITPSKKGTE